MQLFDNSIRTYEGLREPQESIYHFLSRSARPKYEETRNLLEKWFQDYPEPYNLVDVWTNSSARTAEEVL